MKAPLSPRPSRGIVIASESQRQPMPDRQTSPVFGAGKPDFIRASLDHLRGIPPAGGETLGTPPVARQKESLREWARSLGLLLDPDAIVPSTRAAARISQSFLFTACQPTSTLPSN